MPKTARSLMLQREKKKKSTVLAGRILTLQEQRVWDVIAKFGVDGWERVCEVDEKYLLTYCGYFASSKRPVKRDTKLQASFEACLQCIAAYSPLGSTQYTHTILEDEFDKYKVPTTELDARFRKQEQSSKTPIGRMRSVFPHFADFERQFNDIAQAEKKKRGGGCSARSREGEEGEGCGRA